MKRLAAAILLSLCAAGPAQNCKSPSNQMEMDQCAGRDFQAADAKLTALYRSMMSRYDAANQTALHAAEKNWIVYRDAECTFETNGTAGGTINSTISPSAGRRRRTRA